MAILPVYVSGYTNHSGRGIYSYEFDTTTGALSHGQLAAESIAPSWIVPNEPRQRLYALNETAEFNGQPTGAISVFSRDPKTGQLQPLNQFSSLGQEPCHAILSDGYLLVANYGGGSVAAFVVHDDNLSASRHFPHTSPATHAVPDRQEKPHAHAINVVGGRWAVALDLGTDEAIIYRGTTLERAGSFKFPDGTGPRHLKAIGNRCYVVGELSNRIHVLDLDPETGLFTEIQEVYGLPTDFSGCNIGAEIDATLDGRFLYVSMRGHDSIAIFEIEPDTGKLNLIGHEPTGGKHPRHFTIDPSGQFLLVANKVCRS